MIVTANFAHWVCVLAGMFLFICGLLLRDVWNDKPHPTTAALGPAQEKHTVHNVIRRGTIMLVGLAAMAYGISRLL